MLVGVAGVAAVARLSAGAALRAVIAVPRVEVSSLCI